MQTSNSTKTQNNTPEIKQPCS